MVYHHDKNKHRSGRTTRRKFLRQSAIKVLSAAILGNIFHNKKVYCSDNTSNKEIFDVVIIEGGLSGMLSAYLLRKHNIILLEKEKIRLRQRAKKPVTGEQENTGNNFRQKKKTGEKIHKIYSLVDTDFFQNDMFKKFRLPH